MGSIRQDETIVGNGTQMPAALEESDCEEGGNLTKNEPDRCPLAAISKLPLLEAKIRLGRNLDPGHCSQIAAAAGLLAIGLGLYFLAGRIFDFYSVLPMLPDPVLLKVNTALAFCFAGFSLFLCTWPAEAKLGLRRFSIALAGAVAIIGMLTLLEFATSFNLGIDTLFFPDHASTGPTERMAPVTAVNFFCLGLALIFLHAPKRAVWAHTLTACVAFASLLAVVGHLYGAVSLYQSGNFTAMAFYTAIAFLLLCGGLLCASSRYGFMPLVTGSGTSGMLVRRYGLAAIVLPLLLGWLCLQAERSGWYGLEIGVAIFAMASVVIFLILIWIGALSLRAAECKEALAQTSLRHAHTDLELRILQRTSELAEANASLREQMQVHALAERAYREIMDNSIDVICTFDAEGRFLQVNRACEHLWGYLPEELIGKPFLDMVHPDDREKTMAVDQSILSGVAENGFENRYLRKDGAVVWIVWTANWSEALQINVCVARDMTARKHMEIELLRARKAAEAANQAKSEFLATMSHEIRTPMNGIIGMTDLVLETELDREQREYLEIAKSSARALLDLINDILDFSKIEAGKLELETISFSLRDCIGTILKPLGMRAEQKALELTADIPAKVPDHLIGDPMRLRQILINLIDNAIKFTEHGDVLLRVAIDSATDDDHCLHFSICDTGIGIPVAKQVRMFEAFTQADGSTTRTHGGTGLGLAIVSQLVGQMGGRIWIESTMGVGTTFHFTAQLPVRHTPIPNVPRADPGPLEGLRVLVADDNAMNRRILFEMLGQWRMQPTLVASGAAALEELLGAARAGMPFSIMLLDGLMPEMDGFMVAKKIREHAEISGAIVMMLSSAMSAGAAASCSELHVAGYFLKPVIESELLDAILIAIGGTPAQLAPKTVPITLPGRRLSILLVEDNLVNRAVATAILRGHSLAHAANGQKAVEAAARERFDLIFMDVQMPEMDGLEATRRIREAERAVGDHTPIAAMTAHAMSGDRERCLAAGMDDYLSKPLEKTEVLALLERISLRRNSAGT
jgi:PAS domain S-box-containing protein